VATAFSVGSALGSAIDGTLLGASHATLAGFLPAPFVILVAAALLFTRRAS
jgi:hypothetical protein